MSRHGVKDAQYSTWCPKANILRLASRGIPPSSPFSPPFVRGVRGVVRSRDSWNEFIILNFIPGIPTPRYSVDSVKPNRARRGIMPLVVRILEGEGG